MWLRYPISPASGSEQTAQAQRNKRGTGTFVCRTNGQLLSSNQSSYFTWLSRTPSLRHISASRESCTVSVLRPRNKCFSSSTAKQEVVITSGSVIPLVSSHSSMSTYMYPDTRSHHNRLQFQVVCRGSLSSKTLLLMLTACLRSFLLTQVLRSKRWMNAKTAKAINSAKKHSDTSLFFLRYDRNLSNCLAAPISLTQCWPTLHKTWLRSLRKNERQAKPQNMT